VTIPKFEDGKYATYADVNIQDYIGFPMSLRREFFFIKNRFCVVRDTAVFRERFLAKIGPNWVTQNVGRQIGDNWANTYISAPVLGNVKLHNPQMDLLVYHAPHEGRQLVVTDDTADVRRLKIPYTLQYQWRGFVEPGKKYTFAHLLMPGIPSRMSNFPNNPGAVSLADVVGLYMAAGVTVLADDDEKSIWRIRSEDEREEWVVFNDTGKAVEIEGLSTDARRVYVDIRKGEVVRVVLLDGTNLTVAGQEIVAFPERENYDK